MSLGQIGRREQASSMRSLVEYFDRGEPLCSLAAPINQASGGAPRISDGMTENDYLRLTRVGT